MAPCQMSLRWMKMNLFALRVKMVLHRGYFRSCLDAAANQNRGKDDRIVSRLD
jgi:hypothetical protein